MKAGFRDVKIALEQAIVELLDVDQFCGKFQAAPVDGARHQSMKRKGVIGTRGNSKSDWCIHNWDSLCETYRLAAVSFLVDDRQRQFSDGLQRGSELPVFLVTVARDIRNPTGDLEPNTNQLARQRDPKSFHIFGCRFRVKSRPVLNIFECSGS